MEQAGLLTFAKNLGLAGAKFLSANRDNGAYNDFKFIPTESSDIIAEIPGPETLFAISLLRCEISVQNP